MKVHIQKSDEESIKLTKGNSEISEKKADNKVEMITRNLHNCCVHPCHYNVLENVLHSLG